MGNREIKFRAWSISQNEMLQNVGVHPHLMMDLAGDDDYYKDNKDGRFLVCPTFTNYKIMQYTGLKDKNGVEIYEGDIVERIKDKLFGVIYYSYDGYFIKVDNSIDARLHDWKCYCDSIEIIGNIYKNPELLTS